VQDKAIKALTAALAPRAKVIRSGQVKVIEAVNLVPGDVVIVRLGDVVPADIKLIGNFDEEHDQPLQVSNMVSHEELIFNLMSGI
jgi:H+-transporting ATPase